MSDNTTTHQLNLQPRFYGYMQSGTKRIELRLYDEKRQVIALGDTIEFSKNATDHLKMRVVGLLRYESFVQLFNDFDISVLADSSMTKPELLDALSEFYPIEKQNKYGVVGIRVEPIAQSNESGASYR